MLLFYYYKYYFSESGLVRIELTPDLECVGDCDIICGLTHATQGRKVKRNKLLNSSLYHPQTHLRYEPLSPDHVLCIKSKRSIYRKYFLL